MEPRMTTVQVAKVLGVKPQTVRLWRLRGDGPRYVRVAANRVMYRVADVEAWEASRVHSNTSEETAARKRAA